MSALVLAAATGAITAYLLLGIYFSLREGEARLSYVLFWWWIEIMANAIANILRKGRRKKSCHQK